MPPLCCAMPAGVALPASDFAPLMLIVFSGVQRCLAMPPPYYARLSMLPRLLSLMRLRCHATPALPLPLYACRQRSAGARASMRDARMISPLAMPPLPPRRHCRAAVAAAAAFTRYAPPLMPLAAAAAAFAARCQPPPLPLLPRFATPFSLPPLFREAQRRAQRSASAQLRALPRLRGARGAMPAATCQPLMPPRYAERFATILMLIRRRRCRHAAPPPIDADAAVTFQRPPTSHRYAQPCECRRHRFDIASAAPR